LSGSSAPCNAIQVSLICDAIRTRSLIEFRYHGLIRLVEPYCHGFSSRGNELLRGAQVGGSSNSGRFGLGKLWSVADIVELRLIDKPFEPGEQKYNPADRAMPEIHCRV
jgi:hypothetical protein